MGLLVFIRDDQRTTGVVVNIDGPFKPKIDDAYLLVPGPTGIPILVPAMWEGEQWVRLVRPDMCGPTDSGKLADTSDSRWSRAVRQLWVEQACHDTGVTRQQAERIAHLIPTALSVHDRFESWADYDRMSR